MILDFLLDKAALGFYSNGEVRTLNPLSLCTDTRGLTGTEVNAFGLAHTLAGLGHHVRVWSHYGIPEDIIHTTDEGGSLEYRNLPLRERMALPDVAVAFHDARPIQWWQARLKVVWHQTIQPPFLKDAQYPCVDLYLSATNHNAAHLCQYTNGKPWRVVPNGWDYGAYPQPQPVPGRLFYHTSPERGLHVLLKALPLIQREVPEAHLVAWSNLEHIRAHPPQYHAILEGLEACNALVTLHPHGGSRQDVLASLATATLLAYPSEPPMPCEVMPVSIMEACALGVPVVTAPSDGFEKAFNGALLTSPSPPSRHLDAFVEKVVALLRNGALRDMRSRRERLWAAGVTFTRTARLFLGIIEEALRDKAREARRKVAYAE